MLSKLKLLYWVLLEQFKLSKALFFWKFLYAVFDGLSSVVKVYFSAQVISTVSRVALDQGPASDVYKWLLALVILEVAIKAMSLLERILATKLDDKIDIAINKQLMGKMYELSQEQFEDETFNTKISRAFSGMNGFSRMLIEFSWLTSSLVRFFGALVAISAVVPMLGLVIIVVSIPGVFITFRHNRRTEKVYKEMEPIERVAYRTRWMLTDPKTMPEIRLINGFSSLISQWYINKFKSVKAYYDNYTRNSKERFFIEIIEPLVQVGSTAWLLITLVGKSITFEQFLFLRGLVEQFVSTIEIIGSTLENMDQRFIELENLKNVLDMETTLPNGTVKVKAPLTIELKDVSFTYPSAKKETISNISFLITAGTKLALVGENGAGKSTLLKLLMRQYLPSKGEILVNGTSIKDVEQKSYYAALSVLSQNFLTVSHLTIRDNITIGVDKQKDSDIWRNLELAEAHEFVKDLPHKLDTRLDTSFDEGTDLSGGQLQRLGVARALLRGGDILILDEPTSAIDAKAEFKIFNNIYKQHESRTTLIVSHRFSTVRQADGIVVMADGRIIEYGSHEELIKFGGLYKEMFELQAEGYK